ncbi:MAG: diaminopimelate epimerase [Candidatus Competibacteraceae bacterium]|nr:diaminopimelate epimerase [Candidatus Competibacteraceae bacterium]
MSLRFTKMHGLGNDFVVIDGINQPVALDSAQIRKMADRHFGIGCDQLLLVEAPHTTEVDFRYRIFNADGEEVEQCGNGARCFARFVREQGLINRDTIRVETRGGIIQLLLEADGQVTVDMGRPRLRPEEIPFIAPVQAECYRIALDHKELQIGAVSMGNPHAVLQVASVDQAPIAEWGPRLERHERFPQRVNVGFMEVVQRDWIKLRVYERGVGETLACGTGACAAVVVGRLQQHLDEVVRVQLRGGDLTVRWADGEEPVWMTGPATRVYEGWVDL